MDETVLNTHMVRNGISGVKILHNMFDLDYHPSSDLLHLRLLLKGLARDKTHVVQKALPMTLRRFFLKCTVV